MDIETKQKFNISFPPDFILKAEFNVPFYSCEKCNKYSDDKNQLKKCSICKFTYYCSKECQKLDWTNHKKYCNIDFIDMNKSDKLKTNIISKYITILDKEISDRYKDKNYFIVNIIDNNYYFRFSHIDEFVSLINDNIQIVNRPIDELKKDFINTKENVYFIIEGIIVFISD